MATWPLAGCAEFLQRPRWWFAPIAATAAGWIAVVAAAVAVAWWRWPHGADGWWHATLAALAALGWAALAAAAAWLLVLPPLLGFAYERLAGVVQRAAGAPPAPEEPFARALASTLRVVVGTLPIRLAWLAAGLVGSLVGGVGGIVVAALAVAHVGLIDACDVALMRRGLSGRERLAALRAHRDELRVALPAAALLQAALAATIVGVVLFMPSVVTGAARRVLDWPEARPRR